MAVMKQDRRPLKLLAQYAYTGNKKIGGSSLLYVLIFAAVSDDNNPTSTACRSANHDKSPNLLCYVDPAEIGNANL